MDAAANAVADQYVEVVSLSAFGMVCDAYFSGGAGASEFVPLHEIYRGRLGIRVESGSSEGELRYLPLDP